MSECCGTPHIYPRPLDGVFLALISYIMYIQCIFIIEKRENKRLVVPEEATCHLSLILYRLLGHRARKMRVAYKSHAINCGGEKRCLVDKQIGTNRRTQALAETERQSHTHTHKRAHTHPLLLLLFWWLLKKYTVKSFDKFKQDINIVSNDYISPVSKLMLT